MYLRFGRRILIKVLRNEPNAVIQIPDNNTIRMYQQASHSREASKPPRCLVYNGWIEVCTLNNLEMPVFKNNFYNGWTHDHYVSSVLVFCPDGTFPICC
jgi:hypothetical protein